MGEFTAEDGWNVCKTLGMDITGVTPLIHQFNIYIAPMAFKTRDYYMSIFADMFLSTSMLPSNLRTLRHL
jgi:hypothetical protein